MMNSMPHRVGLVTVLYNSEDVLPDFFNSLAKQDYSAYWLYVIDNSPTDTSLKIAQELAAQYQIQNISFIRNAENMGVATGNNQGIRLALEAGSEYVLLLNNDIVFTNPLLLSRMVALADGNSENMIVPKIYFYDTGLIWCAGGNFKRWRGTTSHRGGGLRDNEEFATDCYTECATTCFMLIRRAVFERIGLMDEKYFVYYDDTDFVWRANKTGFKLIYWAGGEVWHKVSSSTGGGSLFSAYYATRNRVYFIRKQMGTLHKYAALTFTLLTRLVKMPQYRAAERTIIWQGIRDGFSMCIHR